MDLLGETERRMIMEEEEGEEKVEEKEITREELINQLKKLKKRKALGENGIENEAWRFMSKEIGEVM